MQKVIRFISVVCVFASVLFSAFYVEAKAVSVSYKSMVLINANTLEILDSHEPHKKLPMASTTKMMTALILAESGDLQKEIVTTKEMVTVEGSSMGLLEGDTVSYYELLVGMMLASGNDAANTAAISLAGSIQKFAQLMNNKAQKIGMNNTNFVTPSGLDDEEHYSTAYDMALLGAELLKNDVLRKIVSSEQITVSYGNPPYTRTLTNHNKLLSKFDNCVGIKTGYTKKSGRCLVSAAEKDGCTVIAVTLNAGDDWNIHEQLLDYGLSQLSPLDVTASVSNIKVKTVGSEKNEVSVYTDSFVCGLGSNDYKFAFKIYKLPFVYAPINKGDVVGRVDYYYDGKKVHSSYLYSLDNVPLKIMDTMNFKQKFLYYMRKLLRNCV